jgi:ferric-dicitrate binding protein FerR (iron transport regulator)
LIYGYLAYKGEIINNQVTNSTIYAPMGSRVSFSLPDGTSGMLNSGSHLSYKIPFNKNRQVTLDGEAWFDVNHDEKHPFEISAGTAVVTVLGTSFNLSAYPVENYIELVLLKGEVEFNALKGDKPVIIMPSERLVLENGNISKSVTEPAKFRAWTEGKLVFRGDPMTEVARRIERWYNVKIILANPALEKYSFRATFQDDSLDDVLKFLSMTSPITFKINPRELLKDGTFKKEEITIYLK